jgi:hypothetical protein
MNISDVIEAQRSHQARLCEALGLDASITTDVTLNRTDERVEWTRLLDGVDLNAYRVVRAESLAGSVALGLHVGQHITVEQWDRALQIDSEWLEQFWTATP